MITYLIIGVSYLWYLEWSTSGKEDTFPWTISKRLFNSLLWPLSLGIYIFGFLLAFFDEGDEDDTNPNN